MGDALPPSSSDKYPVQDTSQPAGVVVGQSTYPQPTSVPHLGQSQQQHNSATQAAFVSQIDLAQTQPTPAARHGSFNMAGMSAALPQGGYRPGSYVPGGHQQRYGPGGSPGMMPQMQQMQQFAGQSGHPGQSQPYYVPQPPQVPQYYGGQPSQSQHAANFPPGRAGPYYHDQVIMSHHQHSPLAPAYYYPPANHFGHQSQSPLPNMVSGQYLQPHASLGDHGTSSQSPQGDLPGLRDTNSNVVRGPPRKPRQSGHAIWIGNLPPQTDLMSLVHHVCKEATGLESLFLISKSNCAFANFKDDATCLSAQQKLHDSKFQSVRLVSRLRKSTVEGTAGVTAPTGPAAAVPDSAAGDGQSSHTQDTTPDRRKASPPMGHLVEVKGTVEGTPQKDRFFILKSLTVEDLELSVRTGIWATQSHNEDGLNSAFQTADNVYLVFSANKSGEYFGYARMSSPINHDPAAAIEFAPKAQSANDLDLPKAIATPATQHAPKGRIIDDSARGTIFWEAEREDGESGDEDATQESDSASGKSAEQDSDGTAKAWGKPFKLEWLSTARLPFYRTRGLRNSWNSNREVKIARDGTELEPSAGRRLIGLFNRVNSPGPGGHGMRPIMGYPPVRPYHQ